jgi:hypothetical protein
VVVGRRLFIMAALAMSAVAFSAIVQQSNYASGHGVSTCMQSRFFRIDSEQFSAYSNITTRDSITITGELSSMVNRNLTIAPYPVAESHITPETPQCTASPFVKTNDSEWRIANASFPDEFVLGAGETIPFSFDATALKPGIYQRLHSAFAIIVNGTEYITYLGRGETITVYPKGEIEHYNLAVDASNGTQNFNVTYILEEPYRVEAMSFDKEQKILKIDLATDNNGEQVVAVVAENKTLAVWVPPDLVHNIGYDIEHPDRLPYRPLNASINGKAIPVDTQTLPKNTPFELYILEIPPGSSEIRMAGAYAIVPEFGSATAAAAIAAAGMAGIIIIASAKHARRRKLL